MNRIFTYFSTFTILFFSICVTAQQTIRCQTDERAHTAYTDYDAFVESYEKSIKKFNESNTSQKSSSAIVIIPVHVIIVHNPGEQIGTGNNFSLEHIQSQIDVLNEDFRRFNTDAGNTPSEFAAADTEIEFCLASIDENGNPTDGVTRFPTTMNMNSNENAIKSATGWDRDDYMNCWSAPNLGGLLGWAYLPSTTNLPNSTLDGIVVAAGSFGGPGYATNTPYHLGRTATHEVGHYLGLRHIWRSDGCGNDDGFADTPLQDDENFGCPNHPSPSCNNSGDMFMNYMDYVNDNCMNAFSEDQGNYMQLILSTSRSSLLNSSAIVCNTTPPLLIDLINQQDLACFGDFSGIVEVAGSGGTPPYQYSVDGGTTQNSGIFVGLDAGEHTFTVVDTDGSSQSISITLDEPNELSTNILELIDNPCFNNAQGQVIIEIAGGTAPYFVNNSAISGSLYSIDQLSAGSYVVLISDANNCSMGLEFTITEPFPIVLSIDELVSPTCFGNNNGSLSYTTNGGTQPYEITLDGVVLSNSVVHNLPAGIYDLDVTDDNGCQQSLEVTIDQPDQLMATPVSVINQSCIGVNDGFISVQAIGGTGPYTYLISSGELNTTGVFENLPFGEYEINIIDNQNCSAFIELEILPGNTISAQASVTQNAECGNNNGSATIIANNGAAPYTFEILENGSSSTNGIFQNLSAGSYTVLVRDDNMCETTTNFIINQTNAVEIEIIEATNQLCLGATSGSITIALAGNPTGATYSIDGENYSPINTFANLTAGDYVLNALDENGCLSTILFEIDLIPEFTFETSSSNPSCFQLNDGIINVSANSSATNTFDYAIGQQNNSTGIFNNLIAGDYEVIITDEFGCSQSSIVELSEGTTIELTAIPFSTSCFSTNTGSVDYLVNNNEGIGEVYVYDDESNQYDLDGLPAGTFTLFFEDSNGCNASEIFTIDEAEPIEFEVLEQMSANCDGSIRGSIEVSAISGVSPFTYTVGQESNSTGYFDNFNAGVYQIIIEDSDGCTLFDNFIIEQLDAFEYSSELISPLLCNGDNDADLNLSTEDPNANYTYRLNNEENTTGLFTSLSAGIYYYEIEDDNACIIFDSITISEPSELMGEVTEEVVNTSGLTDITVKANGGTAGYQYSIDGTTFQDSPTFTDLENNTYTITIRDANGCEVIWSKIVSGIYAENHGMEIYPNPFVDFFSVGLAPKVSSDYQLEIYSYDGKLVESSYKITTSSTHSIKIETSNLESGIYFVKITMYNHAYIKKMIKL